MLNLTFQNWPQAITKLCLTVLMGKSFPSYTRKGADTALQRSVGSCSQGLRTTWYTMLIHISASLTQVLPFRGLLFRSLKWRLSQVHPLSHGLLGMPWVKCFFPLWLNTYTPAPPSLPDPSNLHPQKEKSNLHPQEGFVSNRRVTPVCIECHLILIQCHSGERWNTPELAPFKSFLSQLFCLNKWIKACLLFSVRPVTLIDHWHLQHWAGWQIVAVSMVVIWAQCCSEREKGLRSPEDPWDVLDKCLQETEALHQWVLRRTSVLFTETFWFWGWSFSLALDR